MTNTINYRKRIRREFHRFATQHTRIMPALRSVKRKIRDNVLPTQHHPPHGQHATERASASLSKWKREVHTRFAPSAKQDPDGLRFHLMDEVHMMARSMAKMLIEEARHEISAIRNDLSISERVREEQLVELGSAFEGVAEELYAKLDCAHVEVLNELLEPDEPPPPSQRPVENDDPASAFSFPRRM
jgi:hypothetical protein